MISMQQLPLKGLLLELPELIVACSPPEIPPDSYLEVIVEGLLAAEGLSALRAHLRD